MLVIKLVDSTRWKLFEVELQHNHTVSPEIRRFYKSDKKMILASRKQQELTPVTQVHTIKLYRTSTDAACSGSQEVKEKDSRLPVDTTKHLELKEGDAHALYNYFCHMKLTNPNFFYLMDLDEEGCLRNVFWADASLRCIVQRVPEKLGGLKGYESIKTQLYKAAYNSLKITEFESSWGQMRSQHKLKDNKWLQSSIEVEGERYMLSHISSVSLSFLTCKLNNAMQAKVPNHHGHGDME
ncbi:hypothetical protein CQW23_15151 [Capsicum baccatum]|uniref:Protein FAR1-RELATED SEQUENCE n=1 Tax=Capsicum baccatum TaxID=33114 RepID=A0A2G2WL61_CAPBA|nr:hypothetical protein CQW23_15151 [Capsicum baccatum]